MDFESTLDSNIGAALELSGESKGYLSETAKWAKLIAIVMFVLLGLMGVMMIGFSGFMATMMMGPAGDELGISNGSMTAVMIVYFLIYAAIIFFPTLYLYRFAVKTKSAVASGNTHELTEGFKNLKSCYKFMGILTLIFIVLYGIVLLIMMVMGGAMMF